MSVCICLHHVDSQAGVEVPPLIPTRTVSLGFRHPAAAHHHHPRSGRRLFARSPSRCLAATSGTATSVAEAAIEDGEDGTS